MSAEQLLAPNDVQRIEDRDDGNEPDIVGRRIRRIAENAHSDHINRRAERRLPHFIPATLRFDRAEDCELPAYVRDVSTRGIGLIHTEPVAINDEIWIALHIDGDEPVAVRARICWCHNRDQAWYASGGELLGETDCLSGLLGD